MPSNDMFNILTESRKLNKQISDEKQRVRRGLEKLTLIEKNINDVKNSQLRASSILKNEESKLQNFREELKNIHKKVDDMFEYLDYVKILSTTECENSLTNIDTLKKEKNDLIDKLTMIKRKQEEKAEEVNEIELKISIRKKKIAALLLKLQKNLEERLREENNLLNQLFNSNIKVQ